MLTNGCGSKYLGRADRQIRLLNAEVRWGAKLSSEVSDSTLPRKASRE